MATLESMVTFEDPNGMPVTVRPSDVVRVTPFPDEEEETTQLHLRDGTQQWVQGRHADVVARLASDTEPTTAPAATKELLERLARIEEELLREHARQEAHRQFVEQCFAEMRQAAKTQDKRAFGYTVVGYALTIAGTVVSTPQLRRSVFRLITSGLGPLLGGLPSLPIPYMVD
jgi:hypothetical protein